MQVPIPIKPVRKTPSLCSPDYFVWGASPIHAEGRYHLFASRWEKRVSMLNWATNSEVVHATADSPTGPYVMEEIVAGERSPSGAGVRVAHCPALVAHGGRYYLFITGSHYSGDRPCRSCEGAVYKDARWLEAWNNKRTYLLVSDSVMGPWTLRPEPLLLPRPGKWDSSIISNPAPCIGPGGALYMLYKSANVLHPPGVYPGRFRLGMARACVDDLQFTRVSDEPIRLNGSTDTHIEDPCLWHDGERFHVLMKDMTGEVCGEPEAGIHATSVDGVDWTAKPDVPAYSRRFQWDDGTPGRQRKLERVKVLFEAGKPAYLFFATCTITPEGIFDNTWNLVMEVDLNND